MELKITGCSDCKMCEENDIGIGYSCKVEGKDIMSKNYQPITPEWCPIKKENLTIIYQAT